MPFIVFRIPTSFHKAAAGDRQVNAAQEPAKAKIRFCTLTDRYRESSSTKGRYGETFFNTGFWSGRAIHSRDLCDRLPCAADGQPEKLILVLV